MDHLLFNQIAQTLKMQFPGVSDEKLLDRALALYNQEINKREVAQAEFKAEAERSLEKYQRMMEGALEDSSSATSHKGLMSRLFRYKG